MRPRRFSRMWRVAGRMTVKWPFRCTATTASHSSSVMLKIMRSRRMPAQQTTMWRSPKRASAASTIDWPPAIVATLSAFAIASPPRASISLTTACAAALDGSRPSTVTPKSLTTTRAPAWASPRATPPPPGAGRRRGEPPPVDPLRGPEGEPGRVAARIVSPPPAGAAHRHLPRADQQRVAPPDRDGVRARRRLQIVHRDRVARLEPVDALHARQVEQHAARRDEARHLLHTVLLGALARDEVGVVAVVEPAVEEAVRERVPLGPALERHDHHVVGEADAAGALEGARREVGAGEDHAVDGVEAARLVDLRARVVERDRQGEGHPASRRARRPHDRLGRDVVQRPELVGRPPPGPVAALRSHLAHGVGHGSLSSLRPPEAGGRRGLRDDPPAPPGGENQPPGVQADAPPPGAAAPLRAGAADRMPQRRAPGAGLTPPPPPPHKLQPP